MSNLKYSIYVILIIMFMTLQGKTYNEGMLYFFISSIVAISIITICDIIDIERDKNE